MAELRLVFHPTDTAMSVRVDLSGTDGGSLSGAAPQPFAFQLTPAEYADLRWYLEEYLDLPIGGSVLRARRIEGALSDWGRGLYRAVFDHGEHRDLMRDFLRAVPPRLLTIASSHGDILRLPWELLADERGALTRRDVTIRRQLETVRQPLPYTVHTPLRLLLVVSRPDNAGFIDPRHSSRALLEALTSLDDHVRVEFCRPPTLARLEEMLAEADGAYDIVHFDGHGTYDRLLGLGLLLFETLQRPGQARVAADPVRADRLGHLLARYTIPLVILEACRSSEVHDVALRAVAPRLLEAGVGSVIAMSYAVHVEAAKVFLARFYRELARGRSIGQAMEGGRAALLAQPQRWLEYGPHGRTIQLEDWFLPQLYQRGQDLPLVGPAAPAASPGSATALSGPARPHFPTGQDTGAFPRAPLYQFHGRARELYALERAFATDRAVLLHAMGGMGKTALAREAGAWLTRTGLFADGACFVSCEQPVTAERLAQVLGSYLEGHAFEARPQGEQLARARQLFQERQVLMVWDNFESVLETFEATAPGSQAAPEGAASAGVALPALGYNAEERARLVALYRDWTEDPTGRGRLLITCRPREAGLPGVRRMELAGLARPDSLYLLAQVLRQHDTALDEARFDAEALKALLDTLGDHPLSLELVGPHLKQLTPAQIVERFHTLLAQCSGDAEVERNRSLLASLRFSTSRLSAQAQAALPWLGLFQGGVFEHILLEVSQMDAAVWEGVRAELEATALVRVEMDIQIANRPYLRFHPTLPYAVGGALPAVGAATQDAAASGGGRLAAQVEVRQRFVAVYAALTRAVHQALHGATARAGMEVLEREEANVRTALHWAVALDQFDAAGAMGGTFRLYLERAVRFRERDQWATWLAHAAAQTTFSAAVAEAELQRAWVLLTQGHAAEAIETLQALIVRLQHTTAFETAFPLAQAQATLGRVYDQAGQAERAISLLRQAVDAWERLVRQAAGLPPSVSMAQLLTDQTPAASQQRAASADELGNLSATLGDLANALQSAGRLDEALSTAEHGLAIGQALGHTRNAVAGLAQMASILMQQGRYQEADERYAQALEQARGVGDRELEGTILQHQGGLANDRQHYDRAVALYTQALQRFQGANDEDGIMRTCNLLGNVEQRAGRLAEARAWYERCRDLAHRRGDTEMLGITAQNLGIVCQDEGEAARQRGDEASARQRFADAERFLHESLQMKLGRHDQPGEARSRSQLAQLYLLMGDLEQATVQAQQAREIRESLGLLRELPGDYHTLARTARARGDEAEAAHWDARRDEAEAELERRARGGTAAEPGLSQDMLQAITQLALACVQASLSGSGLPAEAESAVAQLAAAAAGPWQPLGHYLRRLATGPAPDTLAALATPPAGLSEPLQQLFAQLYAAVRDAERA
ncbi:MAG: tetratricopeptide repeat protein [Candidatus Tectimicrobiota bacterium]